MSLAKFSPGGGLGIAYLDGDQPNSISLHCASIAAAVKEEAERHALPLPHLILEPGRSIVGPAGVAIYRVVATKTVPAEPGVAEERFLHVDGGMGDNLRPALYGASYTFGALDCAEATPKTFTIAGRFCESGDIVAREVQLPRSTGVGSLIAVAAAGAYTLSMANNYNQVPRPPVVLVCEGHASLIQRRETEEDLVRRDLPLSRRASNNVEKAQSS